MTIYKIDEKNEIYYEYVPPKDNGYTCVFVNALTGDTSTWTGLIGENLRKDGNGYLTYNFRGQKESKFDINLNLDADLIVSDLLNLVKFVNPKNIILVGLSIGGLYAVMGIKKGLNAKGLVLINTLRKPSERLNWINRAASHAAEFAGTAIIMDMLMPVIASPDFLLKIKDNALNPANYKSLEFNNGINKLMKGGFTANWDFPWSDLDVNTMVMTGHYDKVFRVPEDINELIGLMKKVIRIEIPECGHLIPLEKPELFSYHLKGFIQNLN